MEPSFSKAAPRFKKAVIYEVNIRQYTPEGTFAAFQSELPRLKKLGVDILWLMPIHPISKHNQKGTLGSPYSVADCQGINSDYGTEADFRALVSAVHRNGMFIVMDWVANHSGWDNPWVVNRTWYTQDAKGNIIWPPGTDWTDVADLNYNDTDMRSSMIAAMEYWVRTFDIDGFRADFAGGVPTDFWDDASKQLQTIKPLFMLAEDEGNRELMSSSFFVNYGWSFLKFANDVGQGVARKVDFTNYLRWAKTWYFPGTYPMNFITNHDENSWNGTEFKRLGAAVEQMAALSFIVPGIPLLYSGQEIGMDRQLAFFERDPITWKPSRWTNFYTKLIALKKRNPALWNGNFGGAATPLTTSSDTVIAFARAKDTSQVVYLANISASAQRVNLKMEGVAGRYVDFKTGQKILLPKQLAVTMRPWEWRIYSTVV